VYQHGRFPATTQDLSVRIGVNHEGTIPLTRVSDRSVDRETTYLPGTGLVNRLMFGGDVFGVCSLFAARRTTDCGLCGSVRDGCKERSSLEGSGDQLRRVASLSCLYDSMNGYAMVLPSRCPSR
jgi:hypothetical protein